MKFNKPSLPSWARALVLTGAALTLLHTSAVNTAWAGKPPQLPPSPLDTGTIYYTAMDGTYGIWSMKPEGSAKTFLQPWPSSYSTEPSRVRHGGTRWFLTAASDQTGGGNELYAVNEDGAIRVQATTRPENVELYSPDGSLMYVGPRWATRTDDETGGLVVDGRVSYLGMDTVTGELGIYAADINPDNLGPGFAAVRSYRVRPDINLLLSPDISHTGGYDWSPDGVWVVYDLAQANGGIVVAEAAGQGQAVLVAQDGWYPRWSPVRDNGTTRIAFSAGGGSAQRFDSVNPNGTDRKTIIPPISTKSWVMRQVRWSPHGSHIIYDVLTYKKYMPLSNAQWSTYRATADGAETTCLTVTLDSAHPLGWGAEP